MQSSTTNIKNNITFQSSPSWLGENCLTFRSNPHRDISPVIPLIFQSTQGF